MGAYACICFVEVTKCRVLGSRCESCDECRSTGYEFFTRYRRLCKSIGVPVRHIFIVSLLLVDFGF